MRRRGFSSISSAPQTMEVMASCGQVREEDAHRAHRSMRLIQVKLEERDYVNGARAASSLTKSAKPDYCDRVRSGLGWRVVRMARWV